MRPKTRHSNSQPTKQYEQHNHNTKHNQQTRNAIISPSFTTTKQQQQDAHEHVGADLAERILTGGPDLAALEAAEAKYAPLPPKGAPAATANGAAAANGAAPPLKKAPAAAAAVAAAPAGVAVGEDS